MSRTSAGPAAPARLPSSAGNGLTAPAPAGPSAWVPAVSSGGDAPPKLPPGAGPTGSSNVPPVTHLSDILPPSRRGPRQLGRRVSSTDFSHFRCKNHGEGEQDPAEPGLAGWTVYLDQNQNDRFDPIEPSTVTGSNGTYSFTSLTPGLYTVRTVVPPGWFQTVSRPAPVADQLQLVGSGQNQAIHAARPVGQTFTVGQSGLLSGIELSLFERGSGGDLVLELL